MSEAGVTVIMFVVAVVAFVVLRLAVHLMAEPRSKKPVEIPQPRTESVPQPVEDRVSR
ncbi:hypothetical protein [Lentzea sp. NPDC051838]|uniref:hypothetical protein n=1 Tax=Lentzea sp. NPDC051838 TaxID=3154849 RepID=UPI003415C89E